MSFAWDRRQWLQVWHMTTAALLACAANVVISILSTCLYYRLLWELGSFPAFAVQLCALMQVAVCCWVLFYGPKWFDVPEGHLYTRETGEPSEHHTILFNVFVMMTLFNEVNCRKLYGEANVFEGVLDNLYFVSIVASTFFCRRCCVSLVGGCDAMATCFSASSRSALRSAQLRPARPGSIGIPRNA